MPAQHLCMNTDLGPIELRLRRACRPQHTDELALLERIDGALERLEQGRFGYCESCGGRISIARLEDDPATRICGNCDDE